jgi:hypothetical protein
MELFIIIIILFALWFINENTKKHESFNQNIRDGTYDDMYYYYDDIYLCPGPYCMSPLRILQDK